MGTHRIFQRINALLRDRIASFLELDDADKGSVNDKRLLAAIDALKAELGLTLVERRKVAAQLREIDNGASNRLKAQAEAAIELGEENLARAALLKKAELEKHRAALGLRLEQLSSAARELELEAQRLREPSGDNMLTARLEELESLLKDIQITDDMILSGDR
jgi:phage shock protein A